MKILSCYIAPFGKMNWKITSIILLAAVLVESRGPQQVSHSMKGFDFLNVIVFLRLLAGP